LSSIAFAAFDERPGIGYVVRSLRRVLGRGVVVRIFRWFFQSRSP
jgi:hypothetical protein